MKIICKSDTQVLGYGIVSKGETIEWPDGRPFPPHVLGNFKTAEGEALCNPSPAKAGDKPADGNGDKPADGNGDKPADGNGDKPADGEKQTDGNGEPGNGEPRQPTLEEVAAEQKRAEKIALEELVKKTAALGKQKLTAALDASGVPYKGNASCAELAKALLRSQGQEV